MRGLHGLFERRERNIDKVVFSLVAGIFETNLKLGGELEAGSVASDIRVRSIAHVRQEHNRPPAHIALVFVPVLLAVLE